MFDTQARLKTIQQQYDRLALERPRWKQKNRYYHQTLERIYAELIPAQSRVLEIGCGTGDLLASLKPSVGVGLDLSQAMLALARKAYPQLQFVQGDAGALPVTGDFDFVVLSDLIGHLPDVQETLVRLRTLCGTKTRIIINYYNFVWEPLIRAGEQWGWKTPEEHQNWLGEQDVLNLLDLADFEPEILGRDLLVPTPLFGIAPVVNQWLRQAPLLRHLDLVHYVVARPRSKPVIKPLSTTIVIPCRNELGNIAAAIERMPVLPGTTEVIFVDGASTDGTVEAIETLIKENQGPLQIRLIHQAPKLINQAQKSSIMLPQGKGDAVRQGFAAAQGEVLIILDADLTVPPEDIPRFYDPLASGKAQFVNGTRLVYQMEDEAMPVLNFYGNKFFSLLFTWLLGQPIKDTLCGTKAILKQDYERLVAGRAYFGDFDPFGDFDLLFGAARLKLKIVEVPIQYRKRVAGESKVRFFKHGQLLIRMVFIALYRFKLQPFLESLSGKKQTGRP